MTQDIESTEFRVETTTPSTQTTAPKTSKNKKLRRVKYPWADGPYNATRGENALWIAVITQAMMDAMSRSRHPELRYHKEAAIQWLTGGGKDFNMVCHLAGLEPSRVRRDAKKALLAPSPWRAAAGQGKRYLERKAYRQRMKKNARKPEVERSGEAASPSPSAQIIAGPWQ